VGLCYAYYNLCWIPSTLRVTPAMQAGLVKGVWELGEFMEAILSEPPGEKPIAKPLEYRKPATSARELPNGRGFLRVVGREAGGGAGGEPSPPTSPAAPAPAPVRPGTQATSPVTAAMPIDSTPIPAHVAAQAATPALAAPAPVAPLAPVAPTPAPVTATMPIIAAPTPAPVAIPATSPTAPTTASAAVLALAEAPSDDDQLDLLTWKPRRLPEGQLSLFGLEFKPEK